VTRVIDRLAVTPKRHLAVDHDGQEESAVRDFEAYEEDRISRLGPDAAVPKRLRHKKFAR
jgi:hypothetical protein